MAGVHLQAVQVAVPCLSSEGTACLVLRNQLILFLTDLLAITFASERFFYTLLFAGFQIKRVTLNFLDDVFGLHLALEAPQGILKGFAFLYSNLCQEKYTSKQSPNGISTEYSLLLGDVASILEESCS
jgi:hypothetical protein